MKNFDIEQLERKNIYKAPDNFFAAMQENVLKQTVHQTPIVETTKPEAKIIPMKTNWIYAVAAALALLLGFGFFIKNMNGTTENTPVVTENIYKIENAIEETPVSNETTQPVLAEETQKPAESVTEDLTFGKTENPTVRRQVQITEMKPIAVTEKPKATSAKAGKVKREDVDQLLKSFTSSELAEMSKDAEMDVYLDLYN